MKKCWIKDPWGTPNKHYSHEELYAEFILVLCLRLVKDCCTNLSESIVNLLLILVSQYWIHIHLSLQLNSHVRGNQMPRKGCVKSFLTIDCWFPFPFPSFDKKYWWALKPFLKLHWIFFKKWLKVFRHLLEHKPLIYF